MIRPLILAVLMGSAATAQPISSDSGMDGFVTVDRLPVPDLAALAEGREIWGDTCENCHGGNRLTGAPKITSTKAWSGRIEQGMDVLVDRALTGFTGPKYTLMPARGGNADLTDIQVIQAVAFMVWASGGEKIAEDFVQAIDTKE